METIISLKEQLQVHLDELQIKFIAHYLPARPETRPEDFKHDVKAYCVLSHAAFEEFVEKISIITMHRIIDDWFYKRGTPYGVITLLSFYEIHVSVAADDAVEQDSCFNMIRKSLDEAKSKHSIVIDNNNGLSLSYLRRIFIPIGIDVPKDIQWMESLKTLTNARGSYAHTHSPDASFTILKQKAKHPMTPEKADEIVKDCKDMLLEIAQRCLA